MSTISKYFISCLFTLICKEVLSQDTLLTYYPNTDQRWEKIYKDGDRIAENIYHSNDLPWMTVKYDSASAEKWKWYHENGKPYFQATIINDLLQGTYQIWYENGQLAELLTFKDNLENGPAQFYHPNGQLAMQGTYREGKMVGRWRFYDAGGRLPSGQWQWTFAASNQNLRMEGKLKKGKPIGIWMYRSTADQGRRNQLEFKHSLD